MSEKKKLSKLCLTGSLLTILCPFVLFLANKSIAKMLDGTALWILVGAILLMPVFGLILSIAGLATVRKKGQWGRGFGIVGVILPLIYIAIVAIVALFGFAFMKVLTGYKTDKTITTFYSDSEVVAARYYYHDADGIHVEELDEGRLDAYVADIDSMEIVVGGIANPVISGGTGIEMELEDGTYLTYNGDTLTLASRSRADDSYTYDDIIEDDNIADVNDDFWDIAADYFGIVD